MEPEEDTKDVVTSAAAKLFDIRVMIGGLFTLYGVMLIIYSFFTTKAAIAKAAGIHINLWLGLGMLVLGIVFLAWVKFAPTKPPDRSKIDTTRPAQH